MTIKQQGGIFGRNPTYNDVTVDGSISVNTISEKTSGSGVTIDGFQAIDGGAVASANSPKIDISSANANGYNYRLQSSNSGFFTLSQQDGSVLTGDGTILRYNTSGYFDIYQNLAFANGKGIDFSATSGTGTSELFSDYEQGDWTPTIFGAGTTGSYTFTTQSGRYTKVGDVVYVTAQLTIDTVSTPLSGNVRFGGWPYNVGTNTGLRLTVTSSGVNWDSSTYDHYYGYFSGSGTMQLFGVRDNGAQANLGSSSFTVGAGDTVTITGFYFV